jgi:hypothetical protein
LTRRLLELIGEIEAGRRPMAWSNLDELTGVRLRHPDNLPAG